VTACTFTIRTLETGQLIGQAVLCAEARYCSVLWRGATRPDRRFAGIDVWKAILAQLADKLEPGPLPASSPISQLISGRDRAGGHVVQYLWQEPVDAEPMDVPQQLDLRLQVVTEGERP
jgi:hypothetical protein